jgi:hypothetical protein
MREWKSGEEGAAAAAGGFSCGCCWAADLNLLLHENGRAGGTPEGQPLPSLSTRAAFYHIFLFPSVLLLNDLCDKEAMAT